MLLKLSLNCLCDNVVEDIDKVGIDNKILHNVEEERETIVCDVLALLSKFYEIFFLKTGEVLAYLSIWYWVLSEMNDQTTVSKALLNKQVLKKCFDGFNSKVEILILRVCQDIV